MPQIIFFNCDKSIEHKISHFSHFLVYRSVALITLTSLHNITIIHPQLQLLFSSSQTEPLCLLDPNFPFSPSSSPWVNLGSYVMIYVFLIFFSFFYCGKTHCYGNATTSIILSAQFSGIILIMLCNHYHHSSPELFSSCKTNYTHL